MTKPHKKLLVILGALICLLCLCFGITACNGGDEHKHTFGGFWLTDGADGHYQLATCHPEVKSGLESHVDESGDFKCDVCDYVMHVHVDGNEDGVCDDCQTVLHNHTFEEGWTFNENRHWHEASCDHFTERSDYVVHSFADGVCECGVKESEVKVYALYKNSPEYDLYFLQWLAWLESEGITVEYTESGDGVYHFADGHSEVRFIGERTVKVQAVTGGEPLADVWFMVSLYDGKNYYELNGTIALGLAKTDESGIAEIPFNPVGGYSSGTKQYHIRVALAADVALALKIDEEKAMPIPNRYVTSNNRLYYPYEVNENSNSEDIAATVSFTFSKGWNAYKTIELPYKRYYQDPINGNGLMEEGSTYSFTTSGKDLFDYFIFEPAKYSFKSANSPSDMAKIEENAKQAASGIYKINFAVFGSAKATLYYWNEQGVNLGASHQTKADGTPSDNYITSISGGVAGEGKYTGDNFVNVTILPATGLRQYQLGIISDTAVKVFITVERVDDFVIRENEPITVGDNDNIALLGNGAWTTLELRNVPAGYYNLTVKVIETINATDGDIYQKGMISAFLTKGKEIPLWDGISQLKGLINIPENCEKFYICTYYGDDETLLIVSLNLSLYEGTVVKEGEEISVPVSGKKSVVQAIHLDESVTSGLYRMELTLPGGQLLSGSSYYVLVLVGEKSYAISLPISTRYEELVTQYISITAGDTLSIYILTKGDGSYHTPLVNGKLLLLSHPVIELGVEESVSLGRDYNYYKYYQFIAAQAGTYRISLTQTNEPEYISENMGYFDLTLLLIRNEITQDRIKDNGFRGPKDPADFVTQTTVTFTLEQAETIALDFIGRSSVQMDIQFVIEYIG